MQLSVRKLAQLLDGSIEGDPEVLVDRPSKIEEGEPGSISFLGNPKYESYVYETKASVLLVSRDFEPKKPISATLIRVDNVYDAISSLLEQFGPQIEDKGHHAENAVIHASATIGKDTTISEFCVISQNAKIGNNCQIHAQVFIGKEVVIGNNVTLYPGVKILHACQIGDHCIIHSNVVIGSDGFGFVPQEDGAYKKIAHVGKVIVENQVEIGANTTIDRATMGATIIREGVKLDNLIQVGHNVEIGENSVIAAQAGIAGSTKIGKNCRIGGQVGFVGHIQVADGTQIQAQSGVASAIEKPNTALFGSPAIGYRDYIKSYAIFRKLPELYKRLFRLEKQLAKKNKSQ